VKKEPARQLIKDFIEVVIRLNDTEGERVLKIPIIYIPHNYPAIGGRNRGK
jgi:hypothetical protein